MRSYEVTELANLRITNHQIILEPIYRPGGYVHQQIDKFRNLWQRDNWPIEGTLNVNEVGREEMEETRQALIKFAETSSIQIPEVLINMIVEEFMGNPWTPYVIKNVLLAYNIYASIY